MSVSGKHILITGATAGIGTASAHLLAAAGARLTLLARNKAKAEQVAADVAATSGGPPPQILIADFASLESVREAGAAFAASGEPLDILLNNAGVVCTSRRETIDGFEETFAVNHLAPFLLTGLLLPRLRESATARIVNVSSGAHAFSRDMGFGDLQAEQGFKTFREYGRSKLANILFTRYLSNQLQAEGITVNCLHPGAVRTDLGTQNGGVMSKVLPLLLRPFFKTPEQGAATSVFLCADPSVAKVSGEYYINCKQAKTRPWAQDDEAAARLWQVSEELTGFSYPWAAH
ncbi:SDR family oxidoreductase [Halieaceae bacterium IMCC14734]|uniref:SDR family oxidoreductase n=1 Tax=Candidatus Litorirhabdus singularis TaxID=2518993 RepID=A0ABT3TII2_9GAMM|nr:SDR family oxidoreductase [Candidatus Litorirhabdus singularis]MCX2981209.1 SDR family oxidoreductase [Candidatus Litorirhabdus singularis]